MRRPINAQTLCYQRGSFYIEVRRRQSLYPQLSYPKNLSDLHMYMTAFFLHTLQTATSMRSAETDPDLFCMFVFEKVDLKSKHINVFFFFRLYIPPDNRRTTFWCISVSTCINKSN